MKPKCVITVGVSASGKTTWANQQQNKFKIVCRDNYRRALCQADDSQNLWGVYQFKKHESKVQELWERDIDCFSSLGLDFIVADTNLNPVRRKALVDKMTARGYDVELKAFPITYEEAVKRDSKRRDTVGQQVLYKQWQDWLKFEVEQGQRRIYVPDTSLQPAVIFDIDGTLADMGDRRGPYEWDKVFMDTPRQVVMDLYKNYHDSKDIRAILVSGRDGSCFMDTWRWIADKSDCQYWPKLFMRKAGDMRKDTIVKEEIFWNEIADKYNVLAVFDDRPCVVRTWFDIGIPNVFTVGNWNIEF